jgi:16S rRNA (uracil1498-N3)-methyltransferase
MVVEQYISQSPSVLLVIGPEGGFSPIEVEQAQAAGFVRVGLGRRTLRAETAGLVGLSAIFYHVEQVGRR